jgi:Protein of unknown function (DUF1460)
MTRALLLWFATPLVAAFAAPSEEIIAARLTSRPDALAARLVHVTDPFVGAPYLLSALGEGPGQKPDADPRMRFDAFDCTTFVETALALAIADDLPQARALLDAIRYRKGQVGYLERRHFPEAEWIPELQALGFLQESTRAIGGADVVKESKELNVAVWRRTRHKGTPDLPDARIPSGTFALDVWPLEKATAGADRIPAGTLLNLVRVDFKNIPVRVSHQGLVIDKGGKKYLRHAADRMHHSVVDEPIERFFSRMQKYGKWPVTGVNLQTLKVPADWRALLPAAPSNR